MPTSAMLFVELDEMDMASSGWLTKFKTLAQDYIHHIDEEEEEKFPKAKEAIDEEKAVELRDEFNARKPEEVERGSRPGPTCPRSKRRSRKRPNKPCLPTDR